MPIIERISETAKRHRWALSSALIVGLTLVLVAHAPILPIVIGGASAIAIAVLRSRSRPRVG